MKEKKHIVPREVSAFFSKFGRAGAKKVHAARTPAERKARAKKAAAARWGKTKTSKAK